MLVYIVCNTSSGFQSIVTPASKHIDWLYLKSVLKDDSVFILNGNN